MNFTGGNTLPNIGKRINWQLVTLVGGLAVAVSAAAGLGAFDGGSQKTSVGQDAPQLARPATPVTTALNQPVIYVVGSEEQVDTFRADMASDQIEALRQGQDIAVRETSFVVVEPGDEEFIHNLALGELDAGSFDLIDLRGSTKSASHERTDLELPAMIGEAGWSEASTTPLVILVDSQEDAQASEAAMAADQMEALQQGQEVAMRPTSFVVVEPGDDEFLYNLVLGQLDAGSFVLVDAR